MTDILAEDIQVQDYIYSLVAAPNFSERGVCFAAHATGLRRSEDGGVTWQAAFESLSLDEPLPATSVAVASGAQGDTVVFAGVPGGIVYSNDDCRSWNVVSLPPPSPFISMLALSPRFAEDGTAFAATMEDGVFVTTDRGGRWDAWNIGLLDRSVLCIAVSPAFQRDSLVFAGTESGIFRSTNGCRFWHETPFPIDAAPILCLALSPSFEEDGTLFAGSASGLYRSQDRGQSWQPIPVADTEGAVNAVLLSADFPATPHLLVLLDDALAISRDGGQSWSPCVDSPQDDTAFTSVIAPFGLDPGSPLLVGVVDGRVQQYTLSN